jgi:ubiquinol-cytochrome c reductase cytochrome b/c1 subunit
MVDFVQDTFGADATANLDKAARAKQKRQVADVAIALATESGRKLNEVADLDERIAAGREAIVNEFVCTDCHKFHDDGVLGMAPDLTGYASREWITQLISDPEQPRFYPDSNDRMPAFAAHPGDPAANRLSAEELELLVSWLRGEWYEPSTSK